MRDHESIGIALFSIAAGALLVACGGGSSNETTSVSKLLARSQSGQTSAQESINRTVADLKAAGIQPSMARCALRSTRQPAESFYVVLDIPASEVPIAKGMGFQAVDELTGTDAPLIPLDCATL